MKAVLAEKPSVAREIAMVLGATEKKDGYLTGNGYAVTWAFGHLITLGMPEDYGISACKKQTLPILPDPFKLTIRKVSNKWFVFFNGNFIKQLDSLNIATSYFDFYTGKEAQIDYIKFDNLINL